MLHKYNALSFWDFAAAGPYVQMEMNMDDSEEYGEDGKLAYKDAIFYLYAIYRWTRNTWNTCSQTSSLYEQSTINPGGGTVSYVTSEHRYLDDPIHKEEGGTPDIIGSIRAGLVFQLKSAVGHQLIRQKEHDFITRAIKKWSANPNIQILGNPDACRSIVSFMIKHGKRKLHYNFVVALLNDVFGIQARGGCSCAGPYGHRLLDIDTQTSLEFEKEIVKGCEGIKPDLDPS